MCYNAIDGGTFWEVCCYKIAHKTVVCFCVAKGVYNRNCAIQSIFVLTQQLELCSLCNAKLALITLVC